MRTAVLSEPFSDFESCRQDVLKFLQSVKWSIKLLEVRLWTLAGRPYGSRVWKPDERDLEAVVDQISKFINQNGIPLGAVVMAQEAEVIEFATDFKISSTC